MAKDVWLLDFSAYLRALMLARGNPALGLGGGGAQAAIVLTWAGATAQSPVGVVTMLSIPLMSLVLGVLWRVVLRWIVRRERIHRSEAARARRDSEAAQAATRRFRVELTQVHARVAPVLESLAAGAEIDDAMSTRLVVLEGAVRDRIRSPGLQHPAVGAAVDMARSRGMVIDLLSSHPEGSAKVSDVAAARIADLLDDLGEGGVTIRASGELPADVVVVAESARTAGRWIIPGALVSQDPLDR